MKKLLRVLLMALLGVALTQPVLAYQNAIQIPTSSPLSGLTAIGDLNSAALNYVTLDSGASAPTTTSLGASGTPLSSLAGVVWHDTTTNTIKIRDQADTAWVTLLYLDETNGYGGAVSPVLSSSGAQTVGGSNHPGMFVATGAATYTLTHTTSLWNGFAFAVSAQGGAVTVSINGSDKINGGTSGTGTTIPQGYIGVFKTDGAGNWFLGFERGGPCGVSAGTYTNATVTFDAMGCATSASNGTTPSPNALRNSALTDWFTGTSGTAPTSTGTANWTAEGIYLVPTGAALGWAQQAPSDLASPRSYNSLKITGAGSNTGFTLRFVIDSYNAASLAGQTVTFQLPVLNNSGGSVTPTIATKYPTAQDNWTSATTDLAATNLTAIANAATQTDAYTFTVSANAKNGYEILIAFPAMTSGSVEIGGGFDLHPTPGLTVGIPSTIPQPFIADSVSTMQRDRQFYFATTPNGTAPSSGCACGTGNSTELAAAVGNGSTYWGSLTLPVQMRANPTITTFGYGSGTSGDVTVGGIDKTATAQGGSALGIEGIENTSGGSWASASAFVYHASFDARLAGN